MAFIPNERTVSQPADTTTPTLPGEEPVQFYFKPAYASVAIGQVFPVTVEVSASRRIDTVDMHAAFNSTYLEIVNVTNTSIFPVGRMKRFNNAAGLLDYQASNAGGAPVSGTFQLLTISFRAKQAGETGLVFMNNEPKTEAIFNRTVLPRLLGNATIVIR